MLLAKIQTVTLNPLLPTPRLSSKLLIRSKPKGMPYLTLHNNKNGHMKYGGAGTVSMKVSSSRAKSYPAGSIKIGKRKGLKDEDSLVYLAGRSLEPKKIQALNAQGIHVKYELVSVVVVTIILCQTMLHFIKIILSM